MTDETRRGMSDIPLYSVNEINVRNLVEETTRMSKQLEAFNRAMTGNGTPEKGYIFRIYKLETWMLEMERWRRSSDLTRLITISILTLILLVSIASNLLIILTRGTP